MPNSSKKSDKPVKLNLGCGHRKLDGWVNIDNREEVKPDLERLFEE